MQKQSTFPLGYIKIWLKDKLFLISVAVAFTGIALRLKQYLTNRSLWSDEASLALNIVERSFKELAQPLDYHQGAPLGFLWIQKGIVILFGSSEYALRLVPLICGISSLFIFWFIAAKYLNKRATCLAFTLFAISDLPIYFSSEAKQYSCDVMVGLLTLVMLFSLTKRNQNLGYLSVIGYGLLGAIFIWMSHPAIFFLGSVGISVIYGYYVRSEYNKIKYLVLMGSVWVVSFLTFFITSLYNLTQNQYLLNYWRDGFPPAFSKPLAILEWTIEALLSTFEYPGGLATFGLAAFLYVIGFVVLYQRDRITLIGLSLPIGFTLLASFLGKYPFSNRLILFIIPLLLIPIAEGAEQLFALLSTTRFRLAAPVLIGLLLFQPLLTASNYLFEPRLQEDIRPVIKHIDDNWREGDIIYVYYGAYGQFKYYQAVFEFQENSYIKGIESRQEWVNYLPDLNALQRHKRVWLLFSHVHSGNGVNEEELFTEWLNRIGGTQKDWFPRTGASAYLYEF